VATIGVLGCTTNWTVALVVIIATISAPTTKTGIISPIVISGTLPTLFLGYVLAFDICQISFNYAVSIANVQ
jgi:hypothetical protein